MKLGIGAAAVLAVAGGGLALLRPGWSDGRLSADANVVMRAVARAVLDGNLPTDALAREAALHGHLEVPDPLPEGSKIWFEVEGASAGKASIGFRK